MPDLDTQLRRYVQDAVEQVPELSAGEIMARAEADRTALWQRPRLLAAAAAIAVVAVAAGMVTVLSGARIGDITIGPGDGPQAAADVEQWGPPLRVLAARDGLWVAMQGAADERGLPSGPGGVVRVDPVSGDQARVAQVESMHSVAAGAGSLWATGFTTDQVIRIDPESGETITEIDLPELPNFNDGAFLPGPIAASEGSVWVTTARGYAVRIDPDTNQVDNLYELVPDAPGQVATDGQDAWIAQAQEGITRQAATESETGPTFPVRIDGKPTVVTDVLVDQDRQLWAALHVITGPGNEMSDDDTGAIVRFDMSTMRPALVASTPTPLVEIAQNDGTVWGLDRFGRLWSADTQATGQIAANGLEFEAGSQSTDIAWHGQRLWMTVPDQRMLIRIEPDTLRFATVLLPGDPDTSPQAGATLQVGSAAFDYNPDRWTVIEIAEGDDLSCEQVRSATGRPTIYLGVHGFPGSCPAVEDIHAPWIAFEEELAIYDPGENRPCRHTTVGRLVGIVCYAGQGWQPEQFRTYTLESAGLFIRASSGDAPDLLEALLDTGRPH